MGSSMRWLAVAAVAACALTNASDVPPQGPEPTAPARIRALRPLERVFRRQDGPVTETLDITVAPDTLCGYYSPSSTYSFTCSPGTSCMWENDKYNLAFCGLEDFKTACLGQADALDTNKCDDDCRRDPNIQFCTQDAQAYCFTIYMPNGIQKYPCHTATGFSSMIFPFGADGFPTSTLDVTIYQAATAKPSEPTDESTAEEESKDAENTNEAKESDAETTKPKAGKTVTVGPGASSESESEKDSSQDDGNEKESGGGGTNIGAIVGGVVGGIAIIALVVLAIVLIRRRDRNRAQSVQQQTQPPPPPQQQMQYPVMAQQQQMHYQGWQQTPPPQGFQQSPSPPGFHQTPSPGGYQQSPSTQTSVPGAVEAPDSNTVAVYELPDKVEGK